MEEEKPSLVKELIKIISSYPLFLIFLGTVIVIVSAAESIVIDKFSFRVANDYRVVLIILGGMFLFVGMVCLVWFSIKGDKIQKIDISSFTKGEHISLRPERALVTADYFKLAEKATEVEVIGLTLKTFRDSFGINQIIQFLKEGKNFKILLLFPNAFVTQIRQAEEKNANLANFEADIETTIQTFEKIAARCKDQELDGSLEVRFYDTIPYFAYFRADNSFILGFYFHHKSGLKSQCIYIEDKRKDKKSIDSVSSDFQRHFKTLWEENKNNSFCKIGSSCVEPDRNVLKNASNLKHILK